LIEKASKDRKCDELGIDSIYCISSPFKEIVEYDISKDNTYSHFLDKMMINIENFYSKRLSLKCNKIKLNNVLYIGERKMNSEDEVKSASIIEIFTLQNSKGIFMSESSISNKKSYFHLKKAFLDLESFETIKIKGTGKHAIYSLKKIWSLTRLDIVQPGLFILNKTCCEDSTYYNYNFLHTLKDKSCRQTCDDSNLKCVDYKFLDFFIKFNTKIFTKVDVVGELNSLELVNSTLLIGRYDMCGKDIISDSALCHCAQNR
jgi:hypothetical protein